MFLYTFTIPVTGYDRTVDFQRVNLVSPTPPNRQDLENTLMALHQRDSQHEEYDGTWQECLDVLDKVEKFPRLGGLLIGTNTFVDHPKFGSQPLSGRREEFYHVPLARIEHNLKAE